jgi:hypothetical protein
MPIVKIQLLEFSWKIVTDMETAARSMSNALNSTLLSANAAKEAAIQTDALQAIALQAAIKTA